MLDTGIYTIESKINSCRYVGSAVSLKKRWRDHIRQLSQGVHHSKFMQRSWDKYGSEAFEFKVQIYCDKINLISYEQAFIDFYDPEYNSAPVAGSQLGYKHSAESRKKMSESRPKDFSPMTGKKHTEETKKKISESRTGKGGGYRSPERRAKISAANKGRVISKEQREKISAKLIGHKQSAEQIEKRVQKLRGRKMPEGFAQAASKWMTGRKVSEQTKYKLRRAAAKLTEDQVRDIRKKLTDGERQKELAYYYGVNASVISTINTRSAYGWVI